MEFAYNSQNAQFGFVMLSKIESKLLKLGPNCTIIFFDTNESSPQFNCLFVLPEILSKGKAPTCSFLVDVCVRVVSRCLPEDGFFVQTLAVYIKEFLNSIKKIAV